MNMQELQRNLSEWKSVSSGPFFPQVAPPKDVLAEFLPQNFLDVIPEFGGREGFLGTQYMRLYRSDELIQLNQAYHLPLYNPALFMFASDGYGEAFCFSLGGDEIVKIPLIPIPTDQADLIAHGFDAFVSCLASSGPSPTIDTSATGLEVHLIKPLCFGGDWRDQKNITRVTPSKHAELAAFWNKIYRDLLSKSTSRTH